MDGFWLDFYGILMGEYEEHDESLRINFWTSFDGGVFWSEFSNVDLESLARFLNEPRVDLSSLG